MSAEQARELWSALPPALEAVMRSMPDPPAGTKCLELGEEILLLDAGDGHPYRWWGWFYGYPECCIEAAVDGMGTDAFHPVSGHRLCPTCAIEPLALLPGRPAEHILAISESSEGYFLIYDERGRGRPGSAGAAAAWARFRDSDRAPAQLVLIELDDSAWAPNGHTDIVQRAKRLWESEERVGAVACLGEHTGSPAEYAQLAEALKYNLAQIGCAALTLAVFDLDVLLRAPTAGCK